MKQLAALLFAAISLGAVVGTALAAAPVLVTNCAQDVKGVGDLVADLDCSAVADDAVSLNGRLRLNGFTLTGNPGFDVVSCKKGPCRVTGPGTITGGSDGVRSDNGATVEAGAIVTGNASDGVRTDAVAKIIDSSVTANGGDGVRSSASASITRSTISGNTGDGVRTDAAAKVVESTVTGNGSAGVQSDASASITRSTISGNTGDGVAAKATVNVNASVIDLNTGSGVNSETTVKATNNSFIRNNGLDGLRGKQTNIKNTTATGNGTSPTCSPNSCADLAAAKKPSVRGSSTCETSRNTVFGGTWLVCSND
jgi:hypothetical protein